MIICISPSGLDSVLISMREHVLLSSCSCMGEQLKSDRRWDNLRLKRFLMPRLPQWMTFPNVTQQVETAAPLYMCLHHDDNQHAVRCHGFALFASRNHSTVGTCAFDYIPPQNSTHTHFRHIFDAVWKYAGLFCETKTCEKKKDFIYIYIYTYRCVCNGSIRSLHILAVCVCPTHSLL